MGTLIVNGRYEVLSELGRGGMGIVYRANQRSLNRVVAIKMLSRELAGDPEFRHRFQQEAQIIARIQHDNIVSVYDIESDRGTFFIIMEFVEGKSLQEILRDTGRLPCEKAIRIIAQVARALGFAHEKGIIHRDIKPDNIMIVDDGKPMVMDFGIARVADSTLKTQTGISMGTPKYMSPEQARGQHVDARSDLYSLGVVLYAALTGELPFDGDSPFTIALKHMQEPPPSPREKIPDLPEALEHIVLRSLSKNPADRYQTGEEFAAALEGVLSPTPQKQAADEKIVPTIADSLTAPTPQMLEQPEPSAPVDRTPSAAARALPVKLLVGAASAIVLLAVAWFALSRWNEQSPDEPSVAPVVASPAETEAPTPAPTPELTPSPTATPAPTSTPRIVISAISGDLSWGEADSVAVKAIQKINAVQQAYEQAMAQYAGKPLPADFTERQSLELATVLKTMASLQNQTQQGDRLARMGLINISKELDKFQAVLQKYLPEENANLFNRALEKIPEERQNLVSSKAL